MKKRVLAAFLWFYAGWYGGALLADFLGVSPLIGPLFGAAVAAIIVGDPRHLIWTTRDKVVAHAVVDPSLETAPAIDPV
jgi:uncharacterized protein (DUF697 family)